MSAPSPDQARESARQADGKFGTQPAPEDDAVRLDGARIGFGGVSATTDDSPALTEDLDVAPQEADAFNQSVMGGLQSMSITAAGHIVGPEHQTGCTVVRNEYPGGGRGGPTFSTYSDSAWTRPEQAPMLPWRRPSGTPVAKIGLDGRVSFLDGGKARSVAMGLTPRSDGNFDVDDSAGANEQWGCPRDPDCILHRGHLTDCNADRETWVGAEDRQPGDLGYEPSAQ